MKLYKVGQNLSKMEYCMLVQVACYNRSLPVSKTDNKNKKTVSKSDYQYLITSSSGTIDSLATNLAKFVDLRNVELRAEMGNVQTFYPQNLDARINQLSTLLGFKKEEGKVVNSSIRDNYLSSLGAEERAHMEEVFGTFKSHYFHAYDYDVLRDLYDVKQGTFMGQCPPRINYNYLDVIQSILVALFNYTALSAYPNSVPAYLRESNFKFEMQGFKLWNTIAGIYYPSKKPLECTVEDYYHAKKSFLADLYLLIQEAKNLTKKLYNSNFAILAANSTRLKVDAQSRLEKMYASRLTPSNKASIIEKMIQAWMDYISINTNNGINTALTSENFVSIESCIMKVLNQFLVTKFNEIINENIATQTKFKSTEKGETWMEGSLTMSSSEGDSGEITKEDNLFITETMALVRQLDLQIFCDTFTRSNAVARSENSKCKYSILEWKCTQDLTPYLKDSQQICINFGNGKVTRLDKPTRFTDKGWTFSPIATQAALTGNKVLVAQKYQKHINYYKDFLTTAYDCYLKLASGEEKSWDSLLECCVLPAEDTNLKNTFLVLGEDFKRASDLANCDVTESQECEYRVYNDRGRQMYSFSPEEVNFIKEFNDSNCTYKYFPTKKGYTKICNLFNAFERIDKLKVILAKRKVSLVDLCILYFMDYNNTCFDYKGLIRAGVYTWSSKFEEKLADRYNAVPYPQISLQDTRIVSDAIAHQYDEIVDSKGEEPTIQLPVYQSFDTDDIYDVSSITKATVSRILELAFPISFGKGKIEVNTEDVSPLYEYLHNITTYKMKQILGLILMLCRDTSLYKVSKDLPLRDRQLISIFRGNMGVTDNKETFTNVGVRKIFIKQLKYSNLIVNDQDVSFAPTWSEDHIEVKYVNSTNLRVHSIKSERDENWASNPLARRYSLKYCLKKNKLTQGSLDTIDRRGLTCEPKTTYIFSNLGEMLYSEGGSVEHSEYRFLTNEIRRDREGYEIHRAMLVPEIFNKVSEILKNNVLRNDNFSFGGDKVNSAIFISSGAVHPILTLIPKEDRVELTEQLKIIEKGLTPGYKISRNYTTTYYSVFTIPEADVEYLVGGYDSKGQVETVVKTFPVHGLLLAYYWAMDFNQYLEVIGDKRLSRCLNNLFDYSVAPKIKFTHGKLDKGQTLDQKTLANYVFGESRFSKFLMWCRYLSLNADKILLQIPNSEQKMYLSFLSLDKFDVTTNPVLPIQFLGDANDNVFYQCFYPFFCYINSFAPLQKIQSTDLDGVYYTEPASNVSEACTEYYKQTTLNPKDIRKEVFTDVLSKYSKPTESTLHRLDDIYKICGTIATQGELENTDTTNKIIVNAFDLYNLVIEIPHLLGLLETPTDNVEETKPEQSVEEPVDTLGDAELTDEFTSIDESGSDYSDLSAIAEGLFADTEQQSKRFATVKPQEKVQYRHPLRGSSFFGDTDVLITNYRFSTKFYEFFAECHAEYLKLQMLGKFSLMADSYYDYGAGINQNETSVVGRGVCQHLVSTQLYNSTAIYGSASSTNYKIAGQDVLEFLSTLRDKQTRKGKLISNDIEMLERIFYLYRDSNHYYEYNKDKLLQIQLNVLYDALQYKKEMDTLCNNLIEFKSNDVFHHSISNLDRKMEEYRSQIVKYLGDIEVRKYLENFKRSDRLTSLLNLCELTPVLHTNVDRTTGLLTKNGSFVGSADNARNYSLENVRCNDDNLPYDVTFQVGHYFLHETGVVVAVNECYIAGTENDKMIESLSEQIQKLENSVKVLNEIKEIPASQDEFRMQYDKIIYKTTVKNTSYDEVTETRTLGEYDANAGKNVNQGYPELQLELYDDYQKCIEDINAVLRDRKRELEELQANGETATGVQVMYMDETKRYRIICALVDDLPSIQRILYNYIPN